MVNVGCRPIAPRSSGSDRGRNSPCVRLADPSASSGTDQAPGAGGDAPLAEAILSGGWDTERDLVVLVGAGPAAATASLRRLGQQRILWFRTGDDGSGEALGGVIRVDHLDEVAAAVRALGALGPDRITGRALEPAHARLYDQVVGRIERARSERFLGGEQGATDAARARIQHGLANLPALCRWSGASALGSALAGTPLVIVAPGPSLARNIDALAELQGRAVLLALSHSLGPLRRAGITPDFVLAADAHDVTHHLTGEDMSGIAGLIVAATAHPHMFHSAAPRHLALMEPGPIDSWLGRLAGDKAAATGMAPGGGSVAHTALALALAWGCDPVGFVGLDLSFPAGRCYVDSSADADVRAVLSADGRALSLEGWRDPGHRGRAPGAERFVELPGWDGNPLPSSFHFSMCQRWFEETARRVAGKVRLYNCSEGGAYIGGMRHIRLTGLTGRLLQASRHDPAAATERATGQIDARNARRAARERLVELMLELRSLPAMVAPELDGAAWSLPILSILVDTELGPAPLAGAVGAAGAAGDAERRRAAINRWAGWLEPRVVEAERALAREDRSSETVRLRPLTAAAGKLG